MHRPPVIALTGGIASGKTAVSDRFASRGATVVDTDRIARDVVQPGRPGLNGLIEVFGEAIVDASGHLNRPVLRERIFADASARARVNAVLHPLIEAAAREAIADADGPYVILVVPLLVETGLFGDADRVLVVDVPESVQLDRLTARDGVGRDQARAALAAQATREQRLAVADDVIENSGSLTDLDVQVERLDRRYRDRYQQRFRGPDRRKGEGE
jgi:dephospho-CoA kinase